MTTVIVFVGDAPDDQIAALKRLASEITVTSEEDRLRERQQMARELVESYRNRPARRARPVCTSKPETVAAYHEELTTAFVAPDWSFVLPVYEYPVMPDELLPTPWDGLHTVWNGRWT